MVKIFDLTARSIPVGGFAPDRISRYPVNTYGA